MNIGKPFAGILFAILVTLPMIISPMDMWDGVIIQYASMINDYSGLDIYFNESNWFLQYYMSVAIIELANTIHVSYKSANAVFVLVVMFVIIREVELFQVHRMKLPKNVANISLIMLVTFGAWGDLLSSILTFHFTCIALGMISVRMIHEKDILVKKLIGCTALIFSLNLQSLLVFIPILSYVYDVGKKALPKNKYIAFPSKETLGIFAVSIMLYVSVNIFHPPQGLYLGYNGLNVTSFQGIIDLVVASAGFITYILPLFTVVGMVYVIMLSLGSHMRFNEGKLFDFDKKWILLFLILYFAGFFPYIVVGKASAIWAVFDWTSRQAFVIAIPISILMVVCLYIIYSSINEFAIKRIILFLGVLLIFTNVLILTGGIMYKINRQLFSIQLERILRKHMVTIKPGILQIYGSGIPNPKFRSYESNFLLFRSTGLANWWSIIGEEFDENFSIPCDVINKRAYQVKYVYNHSAGNLNNHTLIELSVKGYQHPLDILRNVLDVNKNNEIIVKSITHKDVVNGKCKI